MGWFIHHVNIQAHDVPEAAAFYREVVGLEEGVRVLPENAGNVGRDPSTIAAFGSGNRGIHVARARPEFQEQNGLKHNPTIGGHFAITVPDAYAVKARLEAAGCVVSDAGSYAMAGMRQLYCFDPSLNLVEINQVIDPSGGPAPGDDEAHGVRMEAGGWYLHHVNIQAHDVEKAAAFYRELVGLPEGLWHGADGSPIDDINTDRTKLIPFGDDNRGIHIVKPMVEFAIRNRFDHNPTIGGHFAVTVPDLEAVIVRLEKAGVPYTDAGTYAMAGIRQVYCFDPSMNFVEINQDVG